jgi:hypothetical protein
VGRRGLKLFGMMVVSCCGCSCLSAGAYALSDGRHYEMVSPVYKEGYGVGKTAAVEPGGESVAFTSKGGFADAPSGGLYSVHQYLARRNSSGWATTSIEPMAGGLADVSANLEYALASVPLGPNAAVENYGATEQVFELHRTDGPDTLDNWEVFGGTILERLDKKYISVSEEGASADLCHIVIGGTVGALLAAAENTGEGQIYDLGRGCGWEQPSLRLIGVNNAGAPINRECPVELGTGRYSGSSSDKEPKNEVNAVDGDGQEIFFTTNVEEGSSCGIGPHLQLFVRLGGLKTVEVSRPHEAGQFAGCVSHGVPGEVPCDDAITRASAYFKGASEDGSRMFFMTRAPLVGEDKDSTNDLYMATIGCPGVEPSEPRLCEASQREVTSLTQVSHDPNSGQTAEVQGTVRVSADGSHIYFVARGVLGEGSNAQGKPPLAGADNLYVYDSVSGSTKFIVDLCSGPELSGELADLQCPDNLTERGDSELWRSNLPEDQVTADGNFLVFSSYARLVPGDTDNAADIYRYSALSGALDRVSIGESAYKANGNGNSNAGIPFGLTTAVVEEAHELANRAIAGDGSRIVFDTAEALSPDATNHKVNIYEWNEGSVALISSGTSEEDDGEASITPSGRDVVFTTSQGLVSQDADGLPDVYDARTGEGFPPQTVEPQQCSGDACQGPLTNPAPLLIPGSVSQAPGGNVSTVRGATVKSKRPKKSKKKKKSRKKGKIAQKLPESSQARKRSGQKGRLIPLGRVKGR